MGQRLILHLHQTAEAKPYDPKMIKPYPIQVDVEDAKIISGDPGDYVIGFAPTAELDPTGMLVFHDWARDGADPKAVAGRWLVTTQRGTFMQDRRPIERAELRD